MLRSYIERANEYFGRKVIAGPNFLEVLKRSDTEAIGLLHEYVGTEHQLLGLISEGSNPILRQMGIDLVPARSHVEHLIGRGDRVVSSRRLTPRALHVIELGVNEAFRLGDIELDPGHLLLGLVEEGKGIGAGIIEKMGISLNQIKLAELERRYLIHS